MSIPFTKDEENLRWALKAIDLVLCPSSKHGSDIDRVHGLWTEGRTVPVIVSSAAGYRERTDY